MATNVLLANNAESTLAATIAAGDTSITVQAADAAEFPSPTGGEWFPLTIVDGEGNIEILKCTARSSAVLTVERGQEGTIPFGFAAATSIGLRLTTGALAAAFLEKLDLTEAATAYAPQISPALTGTPTAPTPGSSDASTTIATTAFVATSLADLVASSPAALDTLNELAAALGDDPNFATTMTTALAGKAATSHTHDSRYYTETEITNLLASKLSLAGGTITGTLGLPSSNGTNEFLIGNGDGASYTLHNFILQGWYGMGLADFSGIINGYYDFRSGTFDVKGGFKVNGSPVYSPANPPPGGGLAKVGEAVFDGSGDLSEIVFTGLVGKRLVIVSGVVGLTASGRYLACYARATGGVWRVISQAVQVNTAGVGDNIAFNIQITNFWYCGTL